MNQMIRTNIPASFFTLGPSVPEDLEEARMHALVGKMLLGEDDRRSVWASEVPRKSAARNTGEETEEAGPYVGDRDSRLFHSATCRWVKGLNQERSVFFRDRWEAVDKEYRPCGFCLPPAAERTAESGSEMRRGSVAGFGY